MSAAMVQDMPFVNVQEWELEDLELQGQQQGRSSNALGRSLRLFVRGADHSGKAGSTERDATVGPSQEPQEPPQVKRRTS
mmetsp:Transcript_107216/g.284292  ORF Transcript_107216/g.284292 Transcript_107216/m.284292 type:complete len:80 (-) Transcript_107216:22-261(-)